MPGERLFLLDGSSYLYRAFHAVRDLTRRDGFPTNAIFGFVNMLRKVLDAHRPEYMAVVLDSSAPTFRHAAYPEYKATRKPMPDALRAQVPMIHELLRAFRLPMIREDGFEADDLMATLATRARANGLEVVLVSGDKDMMQLLEPGLAMLDTMKEQWVGEAEAEAFWGVPPALVTQVMALAGDASDNIPGVPGIGVKTAAQLIREFGSLEALLDQTGRVRQPARRRSLEEFAQQARLSLFLATLDRQAPAPFDAEALRRVEPDRARLHALFLELEFARLAREFAPEADVPPESAPAAPTPVADAPPLSYRAITTWEEFEALLATLAGLPAFALDLETTSLNPAEARIVGLSFSWSPREACYLPVGHAPDAAPDGQLDRERVLARLAPILADPAIAKVGQNLKYECAVLGSHGMVLHGIRDDAMLYSYLLYGATRRHNLDAIALEELGRATILYKEVTGVGKKQVTFDQVPLHRATPYACEDAEVAWEAALRLRARVEAVPTLLTLYDTVERPLIPVLAAMERTGALLDRQALVAMSAVLERKRHHLTAEIQELAGEPFNVNSTQQLGVILFEKMALPGGKKTKTGYGTDVAVLTRLADLGHRLPALMLEYRQFTKLQSTYTDALVALISPVTGRVHTSYNQAVTLTGRLSSSEPNLQNIPVRSEEGRAIRRAFVAPPGWLLLSADYNQIELRLLAHLGQVARLQEAFARGRDIHAATASDLFGVPVDAVTPEARRMAKTINFGLIYGMSAFGLASRLGIAVADAKRYMERYFQQYDGVRAYMDGAIASARERGYAQTLMGRRCPIREIHAANRVLREFAERTAINAPLQGSAADVIKVAMIRLHAALREQGLASRIILQVHDELVLEVPEAERDAAMALVRTSMEGAVDLSVPLRVDIGAGRHWGEAH